MKTIIAVLFAVIAIGLGALTFVQHQQNEKLRSDLVTLREQLDAAEAELAERAEADEKIALAERKAKILQETLKQSSEIAAQQSKQVADLEQSLASKTNSVGFAELFNDPDMREMVKSQQKTILGPMIERNYGAFLRKMNLTPEQAAYVKELIEKKLSISSEIGMELLSGAMDAEKRKEIGQRIQDETAAVDKALEEFLGSDNYKALKEQEKTFATREQIGQLKDQLARSDIAINSAQEEQLVNLMTHEREQFKWTTDFNDQNPGNLNMAEMFTEERVKRFSEEQLEYNTRLVEKAAAFLSHEQVSEFEKHLETQRKMQELGMMMAARMLNSQNNPAQPQTPPR